MRLDIRPVPAAHADAQALMDRLSAVLEGIVGDPGRGSFADWKDGDPGHLFVVGYLDGVPVGCGGLRMLEPEVGEVKRMYAEARGAGTGSALLAHLEAAARQMGCSRLRLETRRSNADAIRFYERRGYAQIPPYGRYVGRVDAVCFEKIVQGP